MIRLSEIIRRSSQCHCNTLQVSACLFRRPIHLQQTRFYLPSNSADPAVSPCSKTSNLYNTIDDEGELEPLTRYHHGGFPVIQIGDVLNEGRYTIMHKLGHGASSTVWLASRNNTDEVVAIKALGDRVSERSQEATILSSFHGQTGIRHMLDYFEEVGPNGKHVFLVLEPALCGLTAAMDDRPIPLPIARTIVAGLVSTVQHLHSKGVVHGDIHTGNILLRLPPFMRRSAKELRDQLGDPCTESVTRKDEGLLPPNVPPKMVWPVSLVAESVDISPEHHLPAMLSDFGESFRPSLEIRDHATTLLRLFPPESFFGLKGSPCMSFPSDIWILGCTILEIITGCGALFDDFFQDEDHVIADHVKVLGKLPDAWWREWTDRKKYYDDDVTVHLPSNAPCRLDSLETRYEDCICRRSRHDQQIPDEDEKRAFLRMISSMLMLDPKKRATIDQILQSEWMQGWAIPRKAEDNPSLALIVHPKQFKGRWLGGRTRCG